MGNIKLPPMAEVRLLKLLQVLVRADNSGDGEATEFLMQFVEVLHEYYIGSTEPD